MLAAADTYVVVLALPDMMAGAGLGIQALQRGTPIISGFLLGYIAVLPLIGRLADLVPRRHILIACLAIFVVGSAVTAVAVELPVMVGGRFLQGLGGGGLVPATLALVADLWPPGRRGMPLGLVGAVQELGAVLGPLLGAAVLLVSTWRAIFWLNVTLGVLCALAIWALGRTAGRSRDEGAVARRSSRLMSLLIVVVALIATVLTVLALWAPQALVTSVAYGEPFVPLAPGSGSRAATPIGLAAAVAILVLGLLSAPRWLPLLLRADLLGATLVALALGSLVLTFSSADPETEVLGPWGLWLLPVGAVAVVGFVIRQRTAADPLVAPGVVRGRVGPALVVSLLVGAALVAIVVDVPLLARLDGETTQTQAALVLVRFLVAVPVGAVLGGLLLRRIGPGLVAAPGLALAAGALVVMATWTRGSLAEDVSTTLVLAAAGLGVGLAIAPVNDAALADARDDAHGTVSSLVVVARMVGMVVGLALLTAVGLRRFYDAVALLPDPTDAQALLDAGVVQVQTVFTGAAIAAALAALLALRLGRRSADRDRVTAS
ncbi:MAG: MFS transporter [Ornithinimicrobium sp.]|uniref:MFS transporter n=1 Tax=Ornithinimicrobium sp. TaxID=1977084 RepID=UPI003D9B1331